MTIVKHIILSFVLLVFMSCQSYAASYSEFRSLLNDIKSAVSDENMVLASDLLSKAIKMLNELEKRPVIAEEAIRWDMAQINLDQSELMQTSEQISYFANESVLKWNDYVEWFGRLDKEELDIIKENLASYRIQSAVRQLGNAYMRRENIGDYTIRDMFEVYSDMPSKYMSSKSMNLWRSWLFRCPSWKPAPNSALRKLKDKFASENEYCREDWEDFYGYLEEWIEEQKLTASKKRKYQRWLKDLGYSLGYGE